MFFSNIFSCCYFLGGNIPGFPVDFARVLKPRWLLALPRDRRHRLPTCQPNACRTHNPQPEEYGGIDVFCLKKKVSTNPDRCQAWYVKLILCMILINVWYMIICWMPKFCWICFYITTNMCWWWFGFVENWEVLNSKSELLNQNN